MKFQSTLLLSALCLASAAVLSERQGFQPAIQTVPSTLNVPGAKRIKTRTGPYTLPSTTEKNLQSRLMGVSGMIDVIGVTPKPCTSGCTILAIQGDLEYANGTRALTSDGSWLHHSVMFAQGPGRGNAACNTGLDAFFSTGNERNPAFYADTNASVIDTGYHVQATDRFQLYSELMNMDPIRKEVYMVLYYDVVPTTPAMTKQALSLWIQLHQCGRPDITPGNLNLMQQSLKQVFTESTAP
ncbi:hypothetical protein LTS18_010413, partial [Coniosporium uncinatum]